VQRILPRRDGSIAIGPAMPGKLYTLQDRFANRGTVVSEVIDAKLVSRWGAIRAGRGAEGRDAERGGPQRQRGRAGRHLERLVRRAGRPAAGERERAAGPLLPVSRDLGDRRPGRVAGTAQPQRPARDAEPGARGHQPGCAEHRRRDGEGAEAAEVQMVGLTDPNEDELVFDLYVRKDGWTEWVKIEEDWSKTEYEWDSTTMPSGSYQFKVVASDRPDNNEDSALTGERVGGHSSWPTSRRPRR